MSDSETIDKGNPGQKEVFGHPVGLYVLFFTELWERFSFYGMRAILMLYMTATVAGDNPGMGWEQDISYEIYSWYGMLVYLLSIPGGIIADKYIGQKKTVLIGGLILVAGHSILAIETIWAFATGLILIVLGVGGLKPNISTMVGGLYKQGDIRRDSGFTIFYIGINVGAFLASTFVGFVGEKIGWHWGFGMAGVGMLIGLLVYVFGQKYLEGIGEAPSKSNQSESEESASLGQLFVNLLYSPLHLAITIILVIASVILGFTLLDATGLQYAYSALFIFLSISAGMMMMVYQDVNKVEKDRFIVLLLSFLIVIVFWGAFEQAGGLLNLYTKQKLNRVISLDVLNWVFILGGLVGVIGGIYKLVKGRKTGYIVGGGGLLAWIVYGLLWKFVLTDPYLIPAAVFQAVNPFFIIIFGTSVGAFWIWWKKKGYESSSLFKMAVGTMIMGSGFIFMAIASMEAGMSPAAKGALIWVILCYLLNTLGELSASPVALSFITKIAPVKYVSIMMGFYFAATGLGNKVAGIVGKSSQVSPISVEVKADKVKSYVGKDKYLLSKEKMKAYPDTAERKDKESFSLSTNIAVEGDEVKFERKGKDFTGLLDADTTWDKKSDEDDKKAEFIKRFQEVEADKPKTEMLFVKKPEHKLKKDEPQKYTIDVSIFQLANKREFRTFLLIFGFTAAFGILLLIFLRKLKKLTHGAEEMEGTHHEEQEPYEVADRETDEGDDEDNGNKKE